MKWKILLTLIALLFCSSLALAQPSQEMPHRVFGTVEDTQGNSVTDTEVEVVFDGETLASDTTDEDGYYDITVPYGEDYSSEEVQIEVSGSQIESFNYNSGKVEEKDLTVEGSQQQDNQEEQSSSGGGGFGGGTLPEQENQDNETETNSTETENETIEDQDNSTTEETTDKSDKDGDNEDTTNSSEDTNSTDSENSLTGMFSSSTSSIGEMFTGFLDTIVSTITSIFN